jgi:hypothetical protein
MNSRGRSFPQTIAATEAHRLVNRNLGLNCEHFCLVAGHRST